VPKDILHLLAKGFYVVFTKAVFQRIAKQENTKDFLRILR